MTSIFPLASVPLLSYIQLIPLFTSVVSETDLEAGDTEWLVELTMFNGTSAENNFPPATICSGPVADWPLGTSLDPGVVKLNYSMCGWIGEPGDSKYPNKLYQGRVSRPWRFTRSIPLTPERGSRATVQYGEVEIINNDGALATAASKWSIDGRQVRVLRGRRSVPRSRYTSFQVIGDAFGESMRDTGTHVTVSLRGREFNTDKPLAPTYGGIGGSEGTADWKNKPKPILVGQKRNIEPDFINPSYLVYRVHFREMQSVDAVRDKGSSLTFSSDYATYSALIGASVAPGTYATCLSEGLIRIGSSPFGKITLDAKGDAFGSYVNTHAGIAIRLAEIGGVPSSDINTSTFDALPSGISGEYFGSSSIWKTNDAIDHVMKSCFASSGYSRNGMLCAYRIFEPAISNFTFELTPTKKRVMPRQLDLPTPPRGRQRVGWQRLGITQDKTQLFSSVSDEDSLYYGKEYQIVTAVNQSTEYRLQRSEDGDVLVSLFQEESDAIALAEFIVEMHKPGRTYYEIVIGPRGYALDIGSVARVTYPQFDLQAGKNMIVVGLKEDGDDVTGYFWG